MKLKHVNLCLIILIFSSCNCPICPFDTPKYKACKQEIKELQLAVKVTDNKLADNNSILKLLEEHDSVIMHKYNFRISEIDIQKKEFSNSEKDSIIEYNISRCRCNEFRFLKKDASGLFEELLQIDEECNKLIQKVRYLESRDSLYRQKLGVENTSYDLWPQEENSISLKHTVLFAKGKLLNKHLNSVRRAFDDLRKKEESY